jgi:hypothetical protein
MDLHAWTVGALCGLLALAGTESLAQTAEGVPASSNVGSSGYPRILPDSRVVFRVKAPDAVRVRIDLGCLYDMQQGAAGVWTVTTALREVAP